MSYRDTQPFRIPFDYSDEANIRLSDQDIPIRNLSVQFRDEPGWVERATDRESFKLWLLKQIKQHIDTDDAKWNFTCTREDITLILDELPFYKKYVREIRKRGFLMEPDHDGVWRMDGVLSEELRRDLVEAVTKLGDILNTEEEQEEELEPEKLGRGHDGGRDDNKDDDNDDYENENKDNSSDYDNEDDADEDGEDAECEPRLRDLLDPSKYPISYNETACLEEGEFVKVTLMEWKYHAKKGLDRNFAWLPSEFKIAANGETKIVSYINNLTLPGQDIIFNPILEKLFTRLVPMFNHVLADIDCGTLGKERTDWPAWRWKPPMISPARSLEGKTLKVIVRMIQIDLIPGSPNYPGSDWHTAGMVNDQIVATAIYNYANDNVSDWSIHFQHQCFHPEEVLYSEERDWNGIQRIGPTRTRENRAIVFPNLLQYSFSDIDLRDKTKPGSAKMLVFHLCDPFSPFPTPSTRTIPPQQPGHYEFMLRQTRLGKLPEDIFQMIMKYVTGTIFSAAKAKKYQKRITKEREEILRKDLSHRFESDSE
ncbi:hypothetical protein TWF281_008754 [Arthrobotrys megalospora]